MIKNARPINLHHQRLWLLPQKAIYWQKKNILLVADLHIGKAGHFRRNGIPIPQQINSGILTELDCLIEEMKPKHLICLGDLFHSHFNEEWQQFKAWRKQRPAMEVTLVMGNHDILPSHIYHSTHISVFKRLRLAPFLFIHDIDKLENTGREFSYYPIGGHVHPAIQLSGKGRQRMKFPCFYFGEKAGILPAFGAFTGTAVIHPEEKDQVYMVVENQILAAK